MSGNELTAKDWLEGGDYHTRSDGRQIFYHRAGSGAPLILIHGFPTWSYDYEAVARKLADDFDVIAPDFLGYGGSDKPKGYAFTVADSADTIESLLTGLGIDRAHFVIHDYGGIVGQELLDRHRRGVLTVGIDSVTLLNCGIVYAEYRPTKTQKLLAMPLIGRLIASRITAETLRLGLNAVRGKAKLSNFEFEQLWHGISRDGGHKLAHRHIRYNAEREVHATRWEDALYEFDGPLQLVWGMADPVSGNHVLNAARPRLSGRRIVELPGVGHFPQSEAPDEVVDAIRQFIG